MEKLRFVGKYFPTLTNPKTETTQWISLNNARLNSAISSKMKVGGVGYTVKISSPNKIM